MEHIYQNLHFLVIDPSEFTRHDLKEHFECRGAVVYTVGLVDKIETVIEGTIHNGMILDCILVDVRLPDCFGLFALKKIFMALQGRDVPVIVMSHGFGKLAQRQMMRWGVVGFLRKPFNKNILDSFLTERFKPKKSNSSNTEHESGASRDQLRRAV